MAALYHGAMLDGKRHILRSAKIAGQDSIPGPMRRSLVFRVVPASGFACLLSIPSLKRAPLFQRVCRGENRRGAALQRLLSTWRLRPRRASTSANRVGAAIASKRLWNWERERGWKIVKIETPGPRFFLILIEQVSHLISERQFGFQIAW